MKESVLIVRLTEDQMKILDAKVNCAGYSKRSDYIRAILFMPMLMEDKIDKIYEKICKNDD